MEVRAAGGAPRGPPLRRRLTECVRTAVSIDIPVTIKRGNAHPHARACVCCRNHCQLAGCHLKPGCVARAGRHPGRHSRGQHHLLADPGGAGGSCRDLPRRRVPSTGGGHHGGPRQLAARAVFDNDSDEPAVPELWAHGLPLHGDVPGQAHGLECERTGAARLLLQLHSGVVQ